MQNLNQTTWNHEKLYADMSSNDEQLLFIYYKREGRLESKIRILYV
jgi:hypothetical protein